MKITITRSFERTRQIADFVPVKAYCEISGDIELEHPTTHQEEELFKKAVSALSQGLDNLCQSEVEKTLINYRPVCIVCGGKGDKVNLNKEGVCGECVKTMQHQAREFAAEREKRSKEHEPPATGINKGSK